MKITTSVGTNWQKLSLMEQLGNVGSEVSRAIYFQPKNQEYFKNAIFRGLDLLDATIADPRWHHRLKELTRAREVLCQAAFYSKDTLNELRSLDKYFYYFALAARMNR